MKSVLKSVSVVIVAGLAGLGAAQATEPDEAIKYRQALMEVIGGHTGAFFAILQGKVDQPDALVYHAQGIANASVFVADAFEQNTAGQGDAETESKDDIWSDWDGFAEDVAAFEAASTALAAAVEAGDMGAIGPAAGALGAACQDCHKGFRTD